MKLLLDENLPIKLKYRFAERELTAYTLKDVGWLGKNNGELLTLMLENNFTTFVTIDNNLSYQQNSNNYPLAVVVLIAKDNTYETIMEFLKKLLHYLMMPLMAQRLLFILIINNQISYTFPNGIQKPTFRIVKMMNRFKACLPCELICLFRSILL
jgi:predicted nuclease of predicted toxin-antitoxin system